MFGNSESVQSMSACLESVVLLLFDILVDECVNNKCRLASYNKNSLMHTFSARM